MWAEGGAITDLSKWVLEQSFAGAARKGTERQLRVILANLYAAWAEDPGLSVALSLTNSAYKAKSRYNSTKLSNQVIDVVGQLSDEGYLHGALGFNDRRLHTGRTTRIWPSQQLVGLFEQAQARRPRLTVAPGTELIILKDAAGRPVEYADTADTVSMRSDLRAYNDLLARTFIDIPERDQPFLSLPRGGTLEISQSNKVVRRVFNRGSWEKGGRFYGGWWQSCPKDWRRRIFINNQPTIEDDYSGLHIVMLYARQGIDYWASVGLDADPYHVVGIKGFEGDSRASRAYAKSLLLMAINAGSDKSAFQAFRSDMRSRQDYRGAKITDAQLSALLDALKEKHKPISEFIGAGAGIDLMNQDAKITAEVIRRFVDARRPILTIHDSYIVMFGDDQRLRAVLKAAFEKVTGIPTVHLKRTGIGFSDVAQGHDADGLGSLTHQHRTDGYLERLSDFHSS
ncbi:MAG: hypothetical protein JNK01_14945 [Devosia sp.]|nr:hypothetical protein [Devosia sp.]